MPRSVAQLDNRCLARLHSQAMTTSALNPLIARRIKALIVLHGGLRAAARATGLDAGYLSYASRGIRQPGPKLLRVLGLSEKKIYANVK